MPPRLDIVGEKYSRLLVIEYSHQDKNGKSNWKCLCDCGNTCNIGGNQLKSGLTKSCGCLRSEMLADKNRSHGKSKTSEYYAWLSAKARTKNVNSIQAKDYVLRGIIMEEPWFSSFESFISDMGWKTSPDLSLERIDVNGNYNKENCVWADNSTQAFNQRKRVTNKSGRTGVRLNKGGTLWEVLITGNREAIYLGGYKDFELACFVRSEAELKYHGFTKE